MKVKPPSHSWVLAPVLTRAAPEVLSKVTPEAKRSWPVPKAEALPMLTEPSLSVNPPAPKPAPLSVSTPAPVLTTRELNVVAPVSVSEEPLAPPPITVQVCAEAAVKGAVIVTAPALVSTLTPLAGLPLEIVSAPLFKPAAMEKALTPVGVAVNLRLLTVRAASRVVAKVVPVVLLALKIRLSKAVGTEEEIGVPETSSAQLLASFQEAPVVPRK